MKKFVLLSLAVILAIGLALTGCGGTEPAPAPAPTPAPTPAPPPIKAVTLRLTNGLPVTHHLSTVAGQFKEELEKATNGAITVEVYNGGELFQHSDVPRVLPVGGVEMSINEGNQLAGFNPLLEAFGNQFMVTTAEEFVAVRDTVDRLFDQLLNQNNIKLITDLDYGRGSFANRKGFIKVPNDIKGLKIRTPTAAASIEAWGGVPVSLAAAEVYDALAKGSIDGALVGWSTFGSRSYYEVAKYYSGNSNSTPWFLLMNLDTWKSFDLTTQQLILDIGQKCTELSKTLAKADDEKWKQMILDKGGEIYTFTADDLTLWRTASRPVHDSWVEKCDKAGVGEQARQILRAIGIPGY